MDFLAQVENICGNRESRRSGRKAYDAFLAAFTALQDDLGTIPPEIVLPLLKICRLACHPEDLDSWLDLAGYAKLGAETLNIEESP